MSAFSSLVQWVKGTIGSAPNRYGPSQIPANWPINWFQWGMDAKRGSALPVPEYEQYPPVAACTSIISQDLSQLPLRHLRYYPDGSSEVVFNKAPARFFKKPNSYQTLANFMLYVGYSLLTDGNFYGYIVRNDRQEVSEIYPLHPQTVYPYIAPDGSVFYSIGAHETVELTPINQERFLPQRFIFHIRGNTPQHPLIGESPLVAGLYPTIIGTLINQHNASFFKNMGRPSGVLRHPGNLSDDAMKRLKEAWRDVTSGPNVGDVVVLREGMDWTPLTMTAVDAEIARMAELSEHSIFQIFRVPPFLGGNMTASSFSNVSELIRFYVKFTLGAWENLIEEAMGRFAFNLPANEAIKFDVDTALLQGDLKTRMEAFAKGVQGGVLKPDEARKREGLGPVEGGDQVFLQMQMQPITQSGQQPEPEPVSSSDGEEPPPDEDIELDFDEMVNKDFQKSIMVH